jgi:hypothetical protein
LVTAGTAAIVGGVSAAVEGISNWVSSWWPFATGSTDIPSDMPAVVHNGEGIVPKTFMDGIRSGDVALTSSDGQSSGNTYISLSVNGSVMTESDLADTIATRISKMKGRGTLS